MTKNKAKRTSPPPSTTGPILLTLGILFTVFSAAMSLALVYEHITGSAIPGCGEDSACARLAEGFGGSLPLGFVDWPTAHVGFAYFAAALATWIATRGTLPGLMRWIVRLGAVGSFFFCVIIVAKWMFCPYCLAAHAGNFAFWMTVELTRARPRRAAPAWIAASVAFVFVTAATAGWSSAVHASKMARGEQEREESVQAIIEQSHRQVPDETETSAPMETPTEAATGEPETEAPAPEPTPEPEAATDPPAAEPGTPMTEPTTETAASAASEPVGFEGRYRYGPEKAPIRIVMITSYQCPDCRFIESQLQKLMEERDDLAVSIKHFPFNTECNPVVGKTSQPNACWAARAAEAAGIIWGSDGFWKMHHFLFDKQGVFRRPGDLVPGFLDPDYPPAEFVQVMTSDETLQRVQRDCREARSLGLFFTPMIFINGVELKGWYAPKALRRTVEAVAASDPPARSAAHDQPPTAVDKYVADWQEQPRVAQPPDDPAWTLGTKGAKLRVVVWGDYQEEGSCTADQQIRAFLAGRDDYAYTWRQYPFNSQCNPNLKDERHPLACLTSRAAEAAGGLGGNEAFWRMHRWLIDNREAMSEDLLRAAVIEQGFDSGEFFARMESPEVAAAIKQDIDAGKKLPRLRIGTPAGLHAIPTIFVNERWIPRWRLQDERIVDLILEDALRQANEDSTAGDD